MASRPLSTRPVARVVSTVWRPVSRSSMTDSVYRPAATRLGAPGRRCSQRHRIVAGRPLPPVIVRCGGVRDAGQVDAGGVVRCGHAGLGGRWLGENAYRCVPPVGRYPPQGYFGFVGGSVGVGIELRGWVAGASWGCQSATWGSTRRSARSRARPALPHWGWWGSHLAGAPGLVGVASLLVATVVAVAGLARGFGDRRGSVGRSGVGYQSSPSGTYGLGRGTRRPSGGKSTSLVGCRLGRRPHGHPPGVPVSHQTGLR